MLKHETWVRHSIIFYLSQRHSPRLRLPKSPKSFYITYLSMNIFPISRNVNHSDQRVTVLFVIVIFDSYLVLFPAIHSSRWFIRAPVITPKTLSIDVNQFDQNQLNTACFNTQAICSGRRHRIDYQPTNQSTRHRQWLRRTTAVQCGKLTTDSKGNK